MKNLNLQRLAPRQQGLCLSVPSHKTQFPPGGGFRLQCCCCQGRSRPLGPACLGSGCTPASRWPCRSPQRYAAAHTCRCTASRQILCHTLLPPPPAVRSLVAGRDAGLGLHIPKLQTERGVTVTFQRTGSGDTMFCTASVSGVQQPSCGRRQPCVVTCGCAVLQPILFDWRVRPAACSHLAPHS